MRTRRNPEWRKDNIDDVRVLRIPQGLLVNGVWQKLFELRATHKDGDSDRQFYASEDEARKQMDEILGRDAK